MLVPEPTLATPEAGGRMLERFGSGPDRPGPIPEFRTGGLRFACLTGPEGPIPATL